MSTQHYSFEDVATRFVRKAANYTAHRYRLYNVEAEDVQQELFVWLFGEGRSRVERWLANDPQQTTRIYRSLLDRALGYAEKEKAIKCGYEVDDITWYTPSMVEALLPLAMDSTYSGLQGKVGEAETSGRRSGKAPNEGGDLLAGVMDIRRAVDSCPDWVGDTFLHHEPGAVGWDEAVQTVINYLGGERPYLGRRRPMSNAQAQAITREQEIA